MAKPYTGPERRDDSQPITRGEHDEWAKGLGERLAAQDKILKRLETAMFAEVSDNEFRQPGVMTTMQRVNQHIDAVCKWARWGRNTFVFLVAVAGGLGTLATAVAAFRAAGLM